MWATIIIRFLRRRLILGLIFSVSLCYCVFSFWGQGDFLDNDEIVPIRRTQPFIWRTLQQHNSSGNDGGIQCRNSIQGRILIVDDRGYVCYRQEVLPNGCCNDTPNSLQYNCITCLKNHCCSIYEHCVSCCLHPDKRNMLETILGKAQEQNSVLFASVTDHFELCLAKCRTNSQSVQHENSYKDPKAKHCYGDIPPGTHIIDNQTP